MKMDNIVLLSVHLYLLYRTGYWFKIMARQPLDDSLITYFMIFIFSPCHAAVNFVKVTPAVEGSMSLQCQISNCRSLLEAASWCTSDSTCLGFGKPQPELCLSPCTCPLSPGQFNTIGVTIIRPGIPFTKSRQFNSSLQALHSPRRHRLIGIRIPSINLRRSSDRLMFIMGIPIPVTRRF